MSKKRKEILAQLLSLASPRTIDEHAKNGKPYLNFFNKYFTDEDLEEFVEKGSLPKLDLISGLSYAQLFSLINNNENGILSDDDTHLINAIFKKTVLNNFLEGLFSDTVKNVNIKELTARNVKSTFFFALKKTKGSGVFYHPNHNKLLKEHIELFTNQELLALIKHFKR